MALTKATILEKIMQRLGGNAQHVHNIDAELLAILQEMSALGDFLNDSDSSLTTTASTAYVSTSDLLIKTLMDVWISSDNHLILGSRSEYLDSIEQSSSITTGEPTKYFQWDNKIYVYDSVPDDAYTLQMEFFKFHAASVDTIEYSDELEETIIQGVLHMLWSGVLEDAVKAPDYSMAKADRCYNKYRGLVEDHRQNLPPEIATVNYRDI